MTRDNQKFLPPPTDADGLLFCACGPTAFTQEAIRLMCHILL